jgi:hypothetical protein
MSAGEDGGMGTIFLSAISMARSRSCAACAAPLASAARSTRLTVSCTPARFSSSTAAFANGPAAAAVSVIAASPRGQGRAGHAQLGVARRQPVLAFRAVVPGTVHGDRAEDRVEGLVPVISESGLMSVPARHLRAALAPVG